MTDNAENTPQIWLLAIRPKTLPAAMAPVMVGAAAALMVDSFELLPVLVALLGSICLQIISNLANDVFDYEKGADTEGRLGPMRVTQTGLLSPTEVKRGIGLLIFILLLIGIYLTYKGGWVILVIGLTAVVSAILYTGGPFPLGYHGLGDFFVFIFFGLAATMGTYYVLAHQFTWAVLLASLPIGFLTVNILVINNLRDIETDRDTGKKTLAVRMGEKWTRLEFLILLILSYAVILLLAALEFFSAFIMLTWLTIPIAWRLTKRVYTQTGRDLNIALAESGKLDFLFGLMFLVGVIVSLLTR